MIEYVEKDFEGLVAIKVLDTICKKDYDSLLPKMEEGIKDCGRINFYLEIKEGTKWDGKSFWSDVNFNLKHAQDIKKVAFVGDEQYEEKIIELLKPIENAEIRWYKHSEKEEAMSWLRT